MDFKEGRAGAWLARHARLATSSQDNKACRSVLNRRPRQLCRLQYKLAQGGMSCCCCRMIALLAGPSPGGRPCRISCVGNSWAGRMRAT